MGNRGGKLHDPATRSLVRTQSSRQWICCVLEFRSRQRKVMGNGYTELFFMDEVTALAAGHRPCFECRRQDALAFRGGTALFKLHLPAARYSEDIDLVQINAEAAGPIMNHSMKLSMVG